MHILYTYCKILLNLLLYNCIGVIIISIKDKYMNK